MNRKIELDDIELFEKDFDKNPLNRVAMNAVTESGINASCVNREVYNLNQNSFSIEVDAGKVCNQKQSGRCWMFAALNVMRLEVMDKLNIENFELSQSYPLFFDKLEKANLFLENIIETLDLPLEGREVAFLLSAPMGDGGQWDMFRSLVEKYGVVPKDVYPESAASSNTRELDKYLTTKLREGACTLRTLYESGESIECIRKAKKEVLNTIYRILCISLGKPPKTFVWEVRDKDKNFIKTKEVTPVDFYKEYVGLDLKDYVTVINAPTKDKPYNETYTVKYLGSVADGEYPVKYLNLQINELKELVIKQLKDNKTVWFGSDVGQFSERKKGFLTMNALEVDKLFSTEFAMDKAKRLDFGESLMTHAMVITGVDLDENEKPVKWKVENSWGDKVGFDGFYVMDDKWFDEYVYQILLDRKYFTKEQSENFDKEPHVLEPWDPMGSLA